MNSLVNKDVAEPVALSNRLKESICDNLQHRYRNHAILKGIGKPPLDVELYLISQRLDINRKTLKTLSLPEAKNDLLPYQNQLIMEELEYDITEEQHNCDKNIAQLNLSQQQAFDDIVEDKKLDPATAYFFLNGLAGIGKTFFHTIFFHHF